MGSPQTDRCPAVGCLNQPVDIIDAQRAWKAPFCPERIDPICRVFIDDALRSQETEEGTQSSLRPPYGAG